MIDLLKILSNAGKPELFASGNSRMWNDKHISAQMLKAHLDPIFDGASRNHDFINNSIEWIDSQIKPLSFILDLGCGPGLYCQPLSLKGHKVTGVDFSENSINYAKEKAQKAALDINYICQDYLEMELNETFDLVLLIYCDFGVLSKKNQQLLLKKINGLLNEKGKLILDVYSPKHFQTYDESRIWNVYPAGFWRPHPHLVLEERFKYTSDLVTLEQYHIVDADGVEIHRNWNKCFEQPEIEQLLHQFGFGNTQVFSDLAGRTYDSNTETLGLLTEKTKNVS